MTQADRVFSTPPTSTPTDTTRRHFLSVAAAGAMSIAAVSATALPVEVDTELVHAARDLEATDQAIDSMHRKYDEADSRDDYRALKDRRNENIATLITIQAKSAAGIQAKAASLRLRAMIEDYTQHQQISVSLADDLVAGIPAAVGIPATAHPAAAVDPIYAAIERHRAACEAHREAVRVEFAFEEVGMTGEKLRQYQILEVATSAAFDDMDDVGCDLVNTKPTTLAGIVALCRYVEPLLNEDGTPQMPEIVAWEDDTESSVAGALANVIAAAVQNMIDAQAGKAVQS